MIFETKLNLFPGFVIFHITYYYWQVSPTEVSLAFAATKNCNDKGILKTHPDHHEQISENYSRCRFLSNWVSSYFWMLIRFFLKRDCWGKCSNSEKYVSSVSSNIHARNNLLTLLRGRKIHQILFPACITSTRHARNHQMQYTGYIRKIVGIYSLFWPWIHNKTEKITEKTFQI